jgi:hypothetical protein
MPLTDAHIRNAKPASKTYKIADRGGLYLLVHPNGGRYWRLDYRFSGRRRTLALGVYPTVTLSDAREHWYEARKLLAQKMDPGAAKKAAKKASTLASKNTFEAVAREWLGSQRHRLVDQF